MSIYNRYTTIWHYLHADTLHSHFSTPSYVLRRRISQRRQQLWIATFSNNSRVSTSPATVSGAKFIRNNFGGKQNAH